MPKKFKGQNSRAVAAQERKAAAAREKDAAAAAAAERADAAEWKKGSNKRAAAKSAAAEAKRAEKERARLLKQQALAAEEEELRQLKVGKAAKSARSSAKKKADNRAAKHDAVTRDMEFMSLEEVSGSGIDAALAALDTAAEKEAELDRHPERRRKAAYQAFLARETARMLEDNPHLKQSQIKNKVFKLWKKSPENPMNQAHAAYNSKKK